MSEATLNKLTLGKLPNDSFWLSFVCRLKDRVAQTCSIPHYAILKTPCSWLCCNSFLPGQAEWRMLCGPIWYLFQTPGPGQWWAKGSSTGQAHTGPKFMALQQSRDQSEPVWGPFSWAGPSLDLKTGLCSALAKPTQREAVKRRSCVVRSMLVVSVFACTCAAHLRGFYCSHFYINGFHCILQQE